MLCCSSLSPASPCLSFLSIRVHLPPSPGPCSLHQVHDEEKGFEMELAWICEESGRQFQRVPQQLAEEAEAAAKAALEAEDMDD